MQKFEPLKNNVSDNAREGPSEDYMDMGTVPSRIGLWDSCRCSAGRSPGGSYLPDSNPVRSDRAQAGTQVLRPGDN